METKNKYSMLIDPEMKEIVDSFIVETKEILEKLDLNLIELENRPDDTKLLNEIFRSFHTIKGTSGFLGLEKLTKVTHRCEDILNKLRKGEVLLDSELMDGILSAFDQIKELLAIIEKDLDENISVDETVEILNKLIIKLENKDVKNFKKIEDTSAGMQEVKENSESKEVAFSVKAEESPAVIQEKSSKKEPSKAATVEKKSENTIRVDIDRLDELLNIASELVLGRNRLAQVNSEIALEYEGTKISRDLSDAAKQIDLMTNELQLVVMKTRMVKIGKVFNRYPRLVRDLARDTKKEVNLILKGEETELDKTLIEEINDPLVHLIRNAVDHGIETPEKRKQEGKNSTGTVILSAEQEGNQIIITIEDDGKGIDTEILKETAVSKGLISREKAKELSKLDAYNLIFIPGFSTAEKVTNVSGRGVGLDVVKTNVAKLRGIISIDSAVGRGTKMIVKLPLTLAIISGMIVEVKSEKVVIPLNSVIEVLRVHIEDIHTINNHEAIRRRDSIIPLVSLDNLLYRGKEDTNKSVWQYVVVIGLAEKRFGIKVDELLGQKEVVIKSLGNYLGNINGIAGSTIMGDGTVIMILDINELLNQIAE
jgi:two-component system chemotaxis sensor kinase CheA